MCNTCKQTAELVTRCKQTAEQVNTCKQTADFGIHVNKQLFLVKLKITYDPF